MKRNDLYSLGPKELSLMVKRMNSKKLVVGLVVGVSLLTVLPSYAADSQHGLALSQRWCASCHLVAPDQKRASADVPPFATVAKMQNFNSRRLAYFLLEPHPKMPDLSLSRSAADDIAAYIESLRR
jgi:mono/diheme cytochrome c family protein